MAEQNTKFRIFSASTLKLMACAFMLIDHVGVRLFPQIRLMRIIGRLAFPLFAFFIAEGCHYTRNKTKHFLSVFLLGLLCESVYIIYDGAWYGNILLSFSLSILLVYAMQYCGRKKQGILWLSFAAILAAVYVLTSYVNFDYGFTGIIVPLFVAIPDVIKPNRDNRISKLCLFAVSIMLTVLGSPMGSTQLFALFTLPLLCLYSGKPGSKRLKYFFYIFYPVHLLLIELCAMLLG